MNLHYIYKYIIYIYIYIVNQIKKLFLLLCKTCSFWYFWEISIRKQQMFAICQTKNSSIYFINVFLYLSIKKELAKKVFSKSITSIVYKDNQQYFILLYYFILLFLNGAIIPHVDTYCIVFIHIVFIHTYWLLIHIVFALYLNFGSRYLLLKLWNCWSLKEMS